MSGLRELLSRDAIRLDVPAETWQGAIRASGELLEQAGIAGASYTAQMIRTVTEHGPYIVIAPGFALAHSRPDDSVVRTGMSFVRLASSVRFGNEANDPVTLVMGLAAADDSAHRQALMSLAGLLADAERREALDAARTPEEVLEALDPHPHEDTAESVRGGTPAAPEHGAVPADTAAVGATAAETEEETVPSKNLILTVCGNGLGTSLFLKNTTEQVLDRWGWSAYLDVEATDTISAKGRAKEADFLLTSGAIAETLGDVGVPVEVIENFTSQAEIDAALRRLYAV